MTTSKKIVAAGPKSTKTNPLPKGEEKGKLKSPYEIVVMGEAAKRFKTNMWDGLANQATLSVSTSKKKGITDPKLLRIDFEKLMRVGEELYMKKYHGKNADAKNKMGVWCYRAFLPSSYRTAKSVAVNCIEHGVTMLRGDEVIGKTACEEAYKAKMPQVTAPDKVTPKTLLEKSNSLIESLDKIMAQMDDKAYDIVRIRLETRGGAKRKSDVIKAA